MTVTIPAASNPLAGRLSEATPPDAIKKDPAAQRDASQPKPPGHCYFTLTHTVVPTKDYLLCMKRGAAGNPLECEPLGPKNRWCRLIAPQPPANGFHASGMMNSSIPATTLGESPKHLIGKTPAALVGRGVARTCKLDLTTY